MAGYCTRCGRPLPENGICPCTMQKRPARKAPNPIATVLLNLPRLWRSYFLDPISTPRRAGERRDWITGAAMLLLLELVSFLSVLLLTMRYGARRFFFIAPQWATAGLVCPLVVMGAMLGVIYALMAMSRMKPELRTVLAVLGVSAVLPLSLLTVTMLLSLIHVSLFSIGCVLTVVAWIVTSFVMLYEVLGIRLNLATIGVLIGSMAAIYWIMDFCRNWLVSALFG